MTRRELSIAFQSDKPPSDYAELAQRVEGYGFDALSIYADLFFQPPIVPLSVAAEATSRIRLGPASLNPFTLHPVEIAGQIASLDLLSGGRAYLGLSRGAWLGEIGVSQDRPLSHLREAIDVVEHLLAGGSESYDGKHFQLTEHHRLRYAVERERVPLLVGSWGRQTLGLAGERADEVKVGGSANPDIVPVVREWIGRGASRGSRQLDEIGICLGAVTVVDEDRDVARSLIRREMALYLPVVAGLDPTVAIDTGLLARIDALVTRGESEKAGDLIPDDLLDRFAFAGTPDDIIAKSEALFAAGVTRIEFGTPHGVTPAEGLRLLGERVLPALR
ncbi:MAG TPA: LLM class flavin-dependent oxidoreductase [Thermomicrobiales bacterium]|nr:LLM class flavin-dependent oxidoreductase [Thermomicrobiales bacterium]